MPDSVKSMPEGTKVPLMLFFHGGSDNPEEAAEMAGFHEIGEREGFITVYPCFSRITASLTASTRYAGFTFLGHRSTQAKHVRHL